MCQEEDFDSQEIDYDSGEEELERGDDSCDYGGLCSHCYGNGTEEGCPICGGYYEDEEFIYYKYDV